MEDDCIQYLQQKSIYNTKLRFHILQDFGIDCYHENFDYRLQADSQLTMLHFMLKSFLQKFPVQDQDVARSLFLEIDGYRNIRDSLHKCDSHSFEVKMIEWLSQLYQFQLNNGRELFSNSLVFLFMMSFLGDALISNSTDIANIATQISSTLIIEVFRFDVDMRQELIDWACSSSTFGTEYLLVSALKYPQNRDVLISTTLTIFQQQQYNLITMILPTIGSRESGSRCSLFIFLTFLGMVLLEQGKRLIESKPYRAEILASNLLQELLRMGREFCMHKEMDTHDNSHMNSSGHWCVEIGLALAMHDTTSSETAVVDHVMMLQMIHAIRRLFPETDQLSEEFFISHLAKVSSANAEVATYAAEVLVEEFVRRPNRYLDATISVLNRLAETSMEVESLLCKAIGYSFVARDPNSALVQNIVSSRELTDHTASLLRFLLARLPKDSLSDQMLMVMVDALCKLGIDKIQKEERASIMIQSLFLAIEELLADELIRDRQCIASYRLMLIDFTLKLRSSMNNARRLSTDRATGISNKAVLNRFLSRLCALEIFASGCTLPEPLLKLGSENKRFQKLLENAQTIAEDLASGHAIQTPDSAFALEVAFLAQHYDGTSTFVDCIAKYKKPNRPPLLTRNEWPSYESLPAEDQSLEKRLQSVDPPNEKPALPPVETKSKSPVKARVNKQLLSTAQKDINSIRKLRDERKAKTQRTEGEKVIKKQDEVSKQKEKFTKMHKKLKMAYEVQRSEQLRRADAQKRYLDLKETFPSLDRVLESEIADEFAEWLGLDEITIQVADEVESIIGPYAESFRQIYDYMARHGGSATTGTFDSMHQDSVSLSVSEWLHYLHTFSFVPDCLNVNDAVGIFNLVVRSGATMDYVQFLQANRALSKNDGALEKMWIISGYDTATQTWSPWMLRDGWMPSRRKLGSERRGICPVVRYHVLCEQLRCVTQKNFRIRSMCHAWPKRADTIELENIYAVNSKVRDVLEIIDEILQDALDVTFLIGNSTPIEDDYEFCAPLSTSQ